MSPGGGLAGQVLLLVPWHTTPDFKQRIAREFPDLEVVAHFVEPFSPKPLPEIEWEKVAVLLTLSSFPKKGQAPKLQLIQMLSAGANHVLNDPICKETDIAFCTANGVHGPQISEWVICTYLALQHHLPKYLDQQREGIWKPDYSPSFNVKDAVGQRVGILGYGSIGRQVARVAKAMGMDVVAYTNSPRDTPESRRDQGYTVPGLGDPDGTLPSKWYSGADTESIDAFLSAGLDLLVLCVPLTDATKGMIGEAQLKLLAEKQTYLSNIARGPIVDTDALMKALDEGWIRGAALDVTDPEPLPQDHPLWKKPNVIITPHMSGISEKYFERVLDILDMNLHRLSEGKPLINKVERSRGY